MISVNRQAATIVEEMIAHTEQLGIAVTYLPCGARIVDLGLKAPGSLLAGKYAAEASLGGMGRVSFLPLDFGDFWLPGVSIEVDQAEIGCMASQYAGWGIRRGDFFAIGSGPARAQAAVEPLFKQKLIDYVDQAETAVLVLEGRTLPNDDVGTFIARKCHVPPDKVTILMAPAACLAGGVVLCARAVATGMHKMFKLGFDVRKVLHGYGTCPVAPVVPDEDLASARLNDCVLYGARVHYFMRADDDELKALIERIPSSASPDYGTPCHDLFMRYGNFYDIDPLLFCPSEVTINNLNSGRTFRAGRPNPQVLRASLLGESAIVGEPKGDSMDGGQPEDILGQLVQVAENRFAAQDREAAQDLILHGFGLLPLELQDLYFDMVDLYRAGKREEASELFEEWLAQARELGLI